MIYGNPAKFKITPILIDTAHESKKSEEVIVADPRSVLPKHQDYEKQKVGSVLFFAPNLGTGLETNIKDIGPTAEQRLFSSLFSLIPGHERGLNFMFHNAVVISNKNDQLQIAHITEKGDVLGYVQETLKEQIERDNDRTFVSFSPNGEGLLKKIQAFFGYEFCSRNQIDPQQIEKEIGKHIGDCCDNKLHPELTEIKWTYAAGLSATVNPIMINPLRKIKMQKTKTQDISSVCSEFAVKALKMGALSYFESLYRMAQHQLQSGIIKNAGMVDPNIAFANLEVKANLIPGYLHIKSNATPKEFYHHLHESTDYSMSKYLGQNPIERAVNCLNLVLDNPTNIKETAVERKTRYLAQEILVEFWHGYLAHKLHQNESESLGNLLETIKEIGLNKLHEKIREKIIEISHGLTIDMTTRSKPSKN